MRKMNLTDQRHNLSANVIKETSTTDETGVSKI